MKTLTLSLESGRRWMSAFLLTTAFALLPSCAGEESVKIEPEETAFTLKPVQVTVVEQQRIEADGSRTALSEEEAAKLFERRIELAMPRQLRFEGEGLYIDRADGITEFYRIRYDGKRLLLFNEVTGEHTFCGEMTGDKQFELNTGFYVKQGTPDTRRALLIVGQDYALEDASDIADGASTCYWAKIAYRFAQIIQE